MQAFSGKQLRQLREEAKFTQKDLSIRLGISRETVSAIEREVPGSIGALDVATTKKWFKVCKARLSSSRTEAFLDYVKSYFTT